MRITELLKEESIELGVKVSDKEETADRLVPLMDAGGRLEDTARHKKDILARGALGSTATDEGIAIPHAKVEAVKEPELMAIVVPEGVNYDAFNDSLANLLFMIAAPAEGTGVHLEALSRLSTLLINPEFKGGLTGAADKDEFLCIIDEAETGRFGAPEGEAAKDAKASAEAGTSSGYHILAVAACPISIVHTYMAAENLENTGKKLGIVLKAGTDGPDETQNVLTREEAVAADAIIVAADKDVEMARFDGKPVITTPVTDGIHKAEELIKRAMDGTVPIYYHTGAARGESVSGGSNGIGRAIYKHLVNDISYMLLFVIGGGILIALVFLFNGYPISPTSFGKDTPLTAHLKTVGKQAFGVMFPILAGPITMGIADRPGLAVDLVVGLIAKMGFTFVNPAGGGVNAGSLGALFAGPVDGYIVVGLRKPLSKLSKSLEGIRPMLLYPAIGIFLAAVVTTLINPCMDMIGDGLTHFLSGVGGTSRIVLETVLGGVMSIDMGGLSNKVVCVFGTVQLTEDNFEVTAAVMAGGMVPPITIALCTTFFKSKFTEKERQFGIVNYIMGLSFIIEGAIPFATQNPLRVIPSCIIGSAIARGLSMAFSCTLRVPHGGIFTPPTIGNHLIYLAAVVVGAVAGYVILEMLKKNTVQ